MPAAGRLGRVSGRAWGRTRNWGASVARSMVGTAPSRGAPSAPLVPAGRTGAGPARRTPGDRRHG